MQYRPIYRLGQINIGISVIGKCPPICQLWAKPDTAGVILAIEFQHEGTTLSPDSRQKLYLCIVTYPDQTDNPFINKNVEFLAFPTQIPGPNLNPLHLNI